MTDRALLFAIILPGILVATHEFKSRRVIWNLAGVMWVILVVWVGGHL